MYAMIFLLTLGLMSILSPGAAAGTVRLAYADRAFPPLQLGDGPVPADPPGRAVTHVLKSGMELDVKPQLSRLPIRRLLHLLALGELDGAFSFSYLPERVRSMVFPMSPTGPDPKRSLGTLNYYLYTRADFEPYGLDSSLTSLRAYRIGVINETAIASVLTAAQIPYDGARTVEQNLLKLQRGRIDIFIGQKEPTQAILRQHPQLKSLRRFGEPLISRDYYLVFSHDFYRQNRQLCESWWRLLAEQREEQ